MIMKSDTEWRMRTRVRRFAPLRQWALDQFPGYSPVAQFDHPTQGTLTVLAFPGEGLVYVLVDHQEDALWWRSFMQVPDAHPLSEGTPLWLPAWEVWLDGMIEAAEWKRLTPPTGWPVNDRSQWSLPPGGTATYPRWIGAAICQHLLLAARISMQITQEFTLERGLVLDPIETTTLLVGLGHATLGTIWLHQTVAEDLHAGTGRGVCAYVWHTPAGGVLWYVPRDHEVIDPEAGVPAWFDAMVYTAAWKQLEAPRAEN